MRQLPSQVRTLLMVRFVPNTRQDTYGFSWAEEVVEWKAHPSRWFYDTMEWVIELPEPPDSEGPGDEVMVGFFRGERLDAVVVHYDTILDAEWSRDWKGQCAVEVK